MYWKKKKMNVISLKHFNVFWGTLNHQAYPQNEYVLSLHLYKQKKKK